MQRECKIAMKSEEFVRRGLPQVKAVPLAGSPERRSEGLRELSRRCERVLETLGKILEAFGRC
ncbi:UNVERIFIED_CONTAM: hypothetical protein Sradi_6966300 [Sesamum radiatum]|uniref:Uncharacterized protein n=1 Tax=Sesamum radiatum TaxID=300843 RepID=A0AAW2JE91_SESRA